MRYRRSGDAGFTLVEVMLSLFLLSIAVLTLLSMFTYGTRSVVQGKKRTEATYIGQIMLERLTSDTLEHVASFNGVVTSDPSTYPAGATERAAVEEWKNVMQSKLHSTAYGTIVVQNSMPVEGMTHITVTVCWPITKDRDSSIQLFLVRRI